MGILKGKIADGGYRPALLHLLLKPKVSGDSLNGLGVKERIRPHPVYHRPDIKKLPWRFVQNAFYMRLGGTRVFKEFFEEHMAIEKKGLRPRAPAALQDTAENWAQKVKKFVLSLPDCSVVGIARVNPEWITAGDTVNEPWIIILGYPMDFDEIRRAPSHRAETGILVTYLKTKRAAFALGDWIHAQGYRAVAKGGPTGGDLLVIPHAISAGLGQLGKHGSMMNGALGSNFRMSYVLTDMPLIADEPVDLGVDEFCASCRLCTSACPPRAIFDTKQMVRGIERWYVSFDKCVPYFNDYWGCQICLAVCPWSRPGVAPSLSQKMLKKKQAC